MDKATTRGAPGLRITDASGLTHALFVRDRFALPSRLAIPPLDPPVDAQQVADVPAGAWDRWWALLLERDPLVPGDPQDPALAQLFHDVREDAARWETAHVRWPGSYDALWVSGWLGEHTLSSSVQALVVGAAGPWHMIVGRGRVLVGHHLFQDHQAMDDVVLRLLESCAHS